MMTPSGPGQALPSVPPDNSGVTFFGERSSLVEVTGSNFAGKRTRLLKRRLNGTTFAKFGATCATGIAFSAVKESGGPSMEVFLSRPPKGSKAPGPSAVSKLGNCIFSDM